MKARSWVVLAAIALAVAGLGVYRSVSTPAGGTPPDTPGGSPAGVPEPEPGHGLPGLLDFGRGECIPCKQMMPILEELARRHEGKILVRYLDLKVPENQARAREMGVRLIPTQILIDTKGEEVIRNEGLWSLEDIEFEMEALGWIPER